jgi:hypothetical protein
MAIWMINCKEFSRLTSESMDHPLTIGERLKIKVHQWICPPCNRLRQQFAAMRKACRMVPAESDENQGLKNGSAALPEDACRKIKSALREHLK